MEERIYAQNLIPLSQLSIIILMVFVVCDNSCRMYLICSNYLRIKGTTKKMSRRCPKRNHFFLNWLKVNRSRFRMSPYLVRVGKRRIEISFIGIAPTLKFSLDYTASGGPWISVDTVQDGKVLEGIIRFYGAEQLTPQGWTSLALRPENIRYWPSREELWIDICFEAFLSWCNRELVPVERS